MLKIKNNELDKNKISPMFKNKEYHISYAIFIKYKNLDDLNIEGCTNWNMDSFDWNEDLYEVFEQYSTLMKSRNNIYEYRIVKRIEVRDEHGISGAIEL